MKLFAALKLRWVVWVWNHTPTCVEMARLASESLDHPLSWKTRLKMRLHWLICVWCRRYFKQIHLMHEHAPNLTEQLESLPTARLSPDAKLRLKTRLQTEAQSTN